MKSAIQILFLFLLFQSQAQSWRSIPKQGNYEVTPFKQFSIDPYRNSIWMIAEDRVAVIEDDGNMIEFVNNELGFLWVGSNLSFAFAKDHIYYAKNQDGMYLFDNYIGSQITTFTEYRTITSNLDSVYLGFHAPTIDPQYTYKTIEGSTVNSNNHFATEIFGKGDVKYASYSQNTDLLYFTGSGSSDYTFIVTNPAGPNDPEFLDCYFNDVSFGNFHDTLFVSCEKGISLLHDNDFFDTITPFNTTNMPSANVLEMEFDENDTLWAVFGDASDNPFAIAKLDGTNWTDEINGSNSPIDFTTFHGFEIDTIGNLWFVDNHALHTIENTNSPGWLGENELTLATKKELVGVYDLLGRESEIKRYTVLIYLYSDGSTEKVFRPE